MKMIMKKSIGFLSLILFLSLNQSLAKGATIQPVERSAGKLNISIDPRMELLSTVQLLSNYPVINRKLSYSKEIVKYFEPFSSQKAVMLTDSLTQKYGFGYDAPVLFMLYSSQLSELEPQVAFLDYLKQRDFLMSRSGRGDNLEQYRKSIKQFAEISDFETFWNSKVPFYNQILDLTVTEIGRMDFAKTVEDYFNETQESYNIIIAPAFRGGYGPRIPASEGKYNIYACLPTEKNKRNIPYLDGKNLLFWIWHEFGHSFVNPEVEKYTDRVASFDKMFDPIRNAMKRQATGDWETCVKEHIVRAVHIRLIEQYFGSKLSKNFLKFELKRGYIYIEPLLEKLKDFENKRDSNNITFSEFFPELINVMESQYNMEYWKHVNTNFREPGLFSRLLALFKLQRSYKKFIRQQS